MALSPAMSALAARTAKAWREEQEQPTCHYCSAPAVISSAIGLEGDFSEPNALGQRSYIAPRPEPRCDECQAGFVNAAKREQRLAEEGWI